MNVIDHDRRRDMGGTRFTPAAARDVDSVFGVWRVIKRQVGWWFPDSADVFVLERKIGAVECVVDRWPIVLDYGEMAR